MRKMQYSFVILIYLHLTFSHIQIMFGNSYVLTPNDGDKSPVCPYIVGQVKYSRYGREFLSFTGIPYAKPPIGSLRFKEPEAVNPCKNNFLIAAKEKPKCIQRNYLFSSNPPIEGEEDCLYLNIYIPQESYEKSPNKLPVMVFIPWGAYLAGGSINGYLGPEYFMDRDVVLVTFNYRLGPFGFLSTTDDEATGNYGYKDQVAVLKWVQAHIQIFGGDKNNVTIFGQSAGAGSVHYHLLSPASEGLFHKAIAQSGTAVAGWNVPVNALQKQATMLQANFVGCGNYTDDNKGLIQCLRSVDARDIMASQDRFRPFFGNPLMIFGSVIESKTEKNPNPFITKTPHEYILNGEVKKVPWMTGVVKNEGLVRAGSLIRPQIVREGINRNFENLTSDIFFLYSLSTTKVHQLYENVTNFYLGGKEYIDITDSSNIQGFVDIYSDRGFFYPLYQTLQLHSRVPHGPIYLYNYEYESKHSYDELFSGAKENVKHHWGTSHCDELLNMFHSPELFPERNKWEDIRMSNILLGLWTNFATYGNPDPPHRKILNGISWHPVNINTTHFANDQIELLNITGNARQGPNLQISKGFYEKRMKFWSNCDIFENNIG